MKSTAQAIATAVEMRDAYTAGHQHRVADLASAIARKIGLPEAQIEGLHFAATIHDVGKINVPSDLLSKPSKLTSLEYQMIQTHAQTGYDIVKGINFPWPIAQMILQHHEKLDGSGYPQRQKIDLKARGSSFASTRISERAIRRSSIGTAIPGYGSRRSPRS